MKSINKDKTAKTVIGITLVGTGACVLVVALPHLVPHLIQWLKGYPVWLIFPVGFSALGLGMFLATKAVSEYINATKKAQETENNGYPERCRVQGGKSHDGE